MASASWQAPEGISLLATSEQVNSAASQVNVAMPISSSSAATARILPRPARVVGMSVSSSVAAAGAAATITLFYDGVATALTVVLPIAATTAFGVGDVAIEAGHPFDFRISTPAGWTSTTADLTVDAWSCP